MPVDEGGHPEAEDLAAFVEGVLPADERNDLELHLLKCADCRDVVAETAAIVAGDGTTLGIRAGRRNLVPFRWSRRAGVATSLAAAAALAGLMVGGVWIASHTGGTGRRLELQELVAAVAKEPVRPVTGRLTGGFRYAPPPPTRSTSPREISPDVRIAAAKLEKLAYDHSTPINQGALGVAYLAIGDLSKAVRELERASAEAPENAGIQNDLSAAYLARADAEGRSEDLSKALDVAERAIREDPNLLEAYFNRVIALERLSLVAELARAVSDYVAREHDEAWIREVKAIGAARPISRRRSLVDVAIAPAALVLGRGAPACGSQLGLGCVGSRPLRSTLVVTLGKTALRRVSHTCSLAHWATSLTALASRNLRSGYLS